MQRKQFIFTDHKGRTDLTKDHLASVIQIGQEFGLNLDTLIVSPSLEHDARVATMGSKMHVAVVPELQRVPDHLTWYAMDSSIHTI